MAQQLGETPGGDVLAAAFLELWRRRASVRLVDDPTEIVDPELGAALRALSAPDLRLLTLVVLEGWSLADAAGVLGLTTAGAKTRLHRARVRLRGAVDPAQGQARPRAGGAIVEGGRS